MIKPDLIVRNYRRSLCLKITEDGKLVVYAPKRLNMNDIIRYIEEKGNWISKKQTEIQNKLNINRSVIDYNEILFLGNKYLIEKMKGIKKIELTDKFIIIPDIDKADALKKIRKWLVESAAKILKERLEYFADIMQIDYRSLTINNTKRRWGSCDSQRNIKLNFRLIMLPHKAIDYVIIHELAHVLEFNHSKDFYKVISMVMPNYKLQQRILKNNDYILNLFR